MTRRPPQPLDAEERAMAALLPRPHGRGEPGADLDARILAAAQAALHPQPAGRSRRNWIGPSALAASLVLAVGLAWQLRPPPSLPAHVGTEHAAPADAAAMSMPPLETPPPAPTAQPQPMAAPPPPQAIVSVPPARDAAVAVDAPAPAPAAPPPPAPPAPVMTGEAAAAALPQASEPARAQAPAMASASDAKRERATVSGTMAAENREDTRRAADTGTPDTIVAGDPEEDVPPATADSPEVREAWLRRIGELLEQGKTAEAKASLAEFRRRYPDAALPPELRKLEP